MIFCVTENDKPVLFNDKSSWDMIMYDRKSEKWKIGGSSWALLPPSREAVDPNINLCTPVIKAYWDKYKVYIGNMPLNTERHEQIMSSILE